MHFRRQIIVKSPYSQQTVALQLDPSQSVLTLSALTSLLESSQRQSLSDFSVALNEKPLNASTRIKASNLPPVSMLAVYPRLLGGGGDGGATGAESRDCYLNMYAEKKPDKVDPNEQRLSKWLNCALSNEPLAEPCVIDLLGNLFNKEALVNALLLKRLPKQFSYIKGLKDMVNIKLADVVGFDGDTTSAKFQCPVSGLGFNGKYKFFALRGCGHVMSAKALKEVKRRWVLLRERMEEEKAKVREKKGVSKKSKNGVAVVVDTGVKVGKRQMDDGNVNGVTVKKFKAGDAVPVNATKEVYASLFTSSKKKSDFRETYSCRSLPLGRN
ncbi:hypothetical protein YC2023_021974 [Brassica napus]